MKRGRPRDEYPSGEFRSAVLTELTRRSWSLRVLQVVSGVNRGTLSAVLNGKRPCGREDRAAILGALGFATETQDRFFPADASPSIEYDRIQLDGQPSPHARLQYGQRLMSRAQFGEAHRDFNSVFDNAGTAGDTTLQAEAACLLGWFHGELEQFDLSRHWLMEAIRLIEGELKMNSEAIVESISNSIVTAESARLAQTLSRAWRIYNKVLTVKILHDADYSWLPEVRRGFDYSLRVDQLFNLPELPHSLRWRAVATATEDASTLGKVDAILSASREMMARGAAGEASLIREQGVVRWQKGRLANAWDFLWDATERLTEFADARALGPTFCVLSKVTLQGNGNPLQARRYALIAAALHPYGYVLDHCRDQMKHLPSTERQREFDGLIAGEKSSEVVHRVLDRVAEGSPHSGADLFNRNLSRVRHALLPSPLGNGSPSRAR